MNIPPEAWRWIREHRTHLDEENFQQAYRESLIEDYGMMLPFLANACSDILDIGCGMAGIDLYLYYHFNKHVHLHLLDGTGDADVKVGFNAALEPYNHLDTTKQLLLMNKVDIRHIHIYPIDPGLTISCDLIISLLSWGFHYPASTYCDLAKRSLRKDGFLILDLRMQTDYDCLMDHFEHVKTIHTRRKKFERMVFRAR